MWRVASEAYGYLAGHPFLTNTVLHNQKTDNDRQIIYKQHTAGKISRSTNQHTHTKQQNLLKKTARIIVVCVPI